MDIIYCLEIGFCRLQVILAYGRTRKFTGSGRQAASLPIIPAIELWVAGLENIRRMWLNYADRISGGFMDKFFLSRDDSVLIIVDIQERLVNAMKVKDTVINNCLHLIELAKIYKIPILLTEQYPKGLGHTVDDIKSALPVYQPIEKVSFSCCGEQGFSAQLLKLGRKTIILTGMETHVCVLQTCVELLKGGITVHLVKDAVCSRTKETWQTGAEFMRDAGAVISCTETVLFQLLGVAGTEEFKAISKRIR